MLMMVLWRKWIAFIRRNLIPTCFTSINARVGAVSTGAIQQVVRFIVELNKVLGVFVLRHGVPLVRESFPIADFMSLAK